MEDRRPYIKLSQMEIDVTHSRLKYIIEEDRGRKMFVQRRINENLIKQGLQNKKFSQATAVEINFELFTLHTRFKLLNFR